MLIEEIQHRKKEMLEKKYDIASQAKGGCPVQETSGA
jgi:hypothetical protein